MIRAEKKKSNPFARYAGVFQGVKIPWILLGISLLCAIISSYVELNSVTLTAQIIDSSQSIKASKLVKYIVYVLESGVLSIVSNYIAALSAQKINLGVRTRLWKKILRLPANYYDGQSGEGLVSRVTSDTDKASTYFSIGISLITAAYAAVASIKRMY
jgi:ATP-binding cassette subfamily B protein AbcA/BmrA